MQITFVCKLWKIQSEPPDQDPRGIKRENNMGAHPQEQEQWSTNKPDYYILFILINLHCNAC